MGDTTIENPPKEIETNQQNDHKRSDKKEVKLIEENPSKPDEQKLTESTMKQSRFASDIFALKEQKNDNPAELFSVRGIPTKPRILPPQQQQNDSTSLTSNNSTMNRNPLTGAGVCSHDEYTAKPNKRKYGNPVLGLGYTEDQKEASTTRIPPGGYSHGLW